MTDTSKFPDVQTAVRRMARDPLLYDDFIDAWDQLAGKQADGAALQREATLALARMQEAEDRIAHRNAMAQDLNRFPYPTCLCAKDGSILATNQAMFLGFGVDEGAKVDALDIELTEAEPLRHAIFDITQPRSVGSGISLRRGYRGAEAKPVTLALLPSRVRSRGELTVLLFVIDPGEIMSHCDSLQAAFDLTDAEQEVLTAFLKGAALAEIASARGRSLATVRTQFNGILSKAGTPTQADLVRTCLAISRFVTDVDNLARANRPTHRRTASILRPRGRTVDVMLVGPPDGQPVIYLHGAFIQSFPPIVEQAFVEAGLQIIGVTRPGFGKTSPALKGGDTRATLAGDIVAVMDQLGIAECALLAHSTAVHHAYAVLDQLSDRLTGLVFAAGWPPPDIVRNSASRSPWSRAMLGAAQKAPSLLNVMTRAAFAVLRQRGVAVQAARAVAESPADLAMVRRPDVAHEIETWLDYGATQGLDAGLEDIALLLADWTHHLPRLRRPVIYVHGDQDPHVPIEDLRGFVGNTPGLSLVEVPDTGHFALWQRPDLFIDALEQLR